MMTFPFGGEDHVIRLRGWEVQQIDKRCIKELGRSLFAMLKEEFFGPALIQLVVEEGLKHQWVGGKKRGLTEQEIANRISALGVKDKVPYDEFVAALFKTLQDGMPQMAKQEDGKDQKNPPEAAETTM